MSKIPYAWDDPTAEKKRLVVRVVKDQSDQVVGETTLALDKIKEQRPLGVGEGLQVRVKAEGPTLTLEITQLLDAIGKSCCEVLFAC